MSTAPPPPVASDIDLLTVTTTMEVGVDVGSLQATVQANMPPQRFNYQQRVGRAGRRRQAFSIVLTVCRNRNHDLYYFRHPEAITGDAPPPPFLSKDLKDPALRFVRKAWLRTRSPASATRARPAGEPYPGDDLRPPDVHGEFVPTDDLLRDGPVAGPPARRPLTQTEPYKDQPGRDPHARRPLDTLDLTVDRLLDELDGSWTPRPTPTSRRPPPASARRSPRRGSSPCSGCRPASATSTTPSRSRTTTAPTEWKTVDRDLDVAIFEFAPGAVLINDKRQLECIGFTAPLPDLAERKKGEKADLSAGARRLQRPFWLVECEPCNGHHRFETPPDPTARRSAILRDPLDVTRALEHRVPNGFRTDFYPKPFDPEAPLPTPQRVRARRGEPPRRVRLAGPANLAVRLQPSDPHVQSQRGARTRGSRSSRSETDGTARTRRTGSAKSIGRGPRRPPD